VKPLLLRAALLSGGCLVSIGAGLVFVPAGLIVAGCGLAAVGLFADDGEPS
jgi:hypothetical protein